MGRNKTGHWVNCSYCDKEKYVSKSKFERNSNEKDIFTHVNRADFFDRLRKRETGTPIY